MFKRIVKFVWGRIPGGVRLTLIRIFQTKFTVSVAAIVTNSDGKVLLLEHLMRPQRSGWGIPGGFLDIGEQPADAIRRELAEETGVGLSELKMINVRTIGRHVEIMYVATSTDEARVISPEICTLGWFDPAEMPAEMSEIQKSRVRETLEAPNLLNV